MKKIFTLLYIIMAFSAKADLGRTKKVGYFFMLLLLFNILSGCISERPYSYIVYQKIKKAEPSLPISLGNDYLTVKTGNLKKIDSLVTSTKLNSRLIPAIVYWQWDYSIKCDIDPFTLVNILGTSMLAYADTINLKEKLNGQKLEIVVESIPSDFIYYDEGDLVFPLPFILHDTKAIAPSEQNLKVTYKFIKTDEEREGTLIIDSEDSPMEETWISADKITRSYMDQYHQHITNLSRKLINKLLQKI